MPVKTLSFKDHLDLTDRLGIALEYLRRGGFYGAVTDLANAYNTNRQRVYDILDPISSNAQARGSHRKADWCSKG